MLKSCIEGVYNIIQPEDPLPLVFDSPHSGRLYPDDFHYTCDFETLQQAEDNHVDELFTCAPAYRAALLCALFPRTYIDPNRAPGDIDVNLLAGEWPGLLEPTARAHAGIGLVRRLVRPGLPVYSAPLSVEEVRHRIENYYNPYHEALEKLIEESHYAFGQCFHINCHSMPSIMGSTRTSRRITAALGFQPDFVIGDRDGTSSSLDFTHALRDYLKNAGYRVTLNNPYKGVEILQRHGNPATGRHSIQLEINKALYWNEAENRKSRHFNELRDEIEKLVAFCAAYVDSAISTPMAAD